MWQWSYWLPFEDVVVTSGVPLEDEVTPWSGLKSVTSQSRSRMGRMTSESLQDGALPFTRVQKPPHTLSHSQPPLSNTPFTTHTWYQPYVPLAYPSGLLLPSSQEAGSGVSGRFLVWMLPNRGDLPATLLILNLTSVLSHLNIYTNIDIQDGMRVWAHTELTQAPAGYAWGSHNTQGGDMPSSYRSEGVDKMDIWG